MKIIQQLVKQIRLDGRYIYSTDISYGKYSIGRLTAVKPTDRQLRKLKRSIRKIAVELAERNV